MDGERPAPTPFEAFERAVAIEGGQSAYGRLISRRQSTISDWMKAKRRLEAEYVLVTEESTGVSRHLLRPDIYPLPDGKRWPELPPLPAQSSRVPGDRQPILSQARA